MNAGQISNFIATAFICFLTCVTAKAQQSPAVPTSPTADPKAVFTVLTGRWVRVDGGYVISIKAVDADGKLDASYANPRPLQFYAADVTREADALKLFFELRDGGYNGSTYTLKFDAVRDQLVGVYYQAVAKQRFAVIFVRAK